jgi:hypothetical protein
MQEKVDMKVSVSMVLVVDIDTYVGMHESEATSRGT